MPLKLELLSSIIAGSSRYVYKNAYAAAWAARLPIPYSPARAALFDNLFESISTIIPKLDALYIMHGAEYRDAARLNLVQDRFNLIEVGSANLEFSPNYGFRIPSGTTGARSQYLDTGINFATTTGLKSSLNNKTFGTGAFSAIGGPSITGNAANPQGSGGWTFFGLGTGSRMDCTATRNSPGTSDIGHAAVVRNNSANYVRYKDSAPLETINISSSSPANDQSFLLLTRGIITDGVPYSPMAYFYTGAAITAAEQQVLYYALNLFYSSIGAEAIAARTVQGSLSST